MGAEVKSMEVKRSESSLTADSAQAKKKLTDFVSDIKGEIFKITWTSQEELITYSKIVVGMTLFFGLAIYVIDLLIQGSLGGLSYFLRIISG